MKKSERGLLPVPKHQDVLESVEQGIQSLISGLGKQGPLESTAMWAKLVYGPLVNAVLPGIAEAQGTTLIKEVRLLQEKGQIKLDVFVETQNVLNLSEVLKRIQSGALNDQELFRAIKSIFLSSLLGDADENTRRLARSFLDLCGRLSSDELLILRTAYQKLQTDTLKDHSTEHWRKEIASASGLNLYEIIAAREKHLIEEKLISNYRYSSDDSGFHDIKNYGLTSLGVNFCEFFVKYREDQV